MKFLLVNGYSPWVYPLKTPIINLMKRTKNMNRPLLLLIGLLVFSTSLKAEINNFVWEELEVGNETDFSNAGTPLDSHIANVKYVASRIGNQFCLQPKLIDGGCSPNSTNCALTFDARQRYYNGTNASILAAPLNIQPTDISFEMVSTIEYNEIVFGGTTQASSSNLLNLQEYQAGVFWYERGFLYNSEVPLPAGCTAPLSNRTFKMIDRHAGVVEIYVTSKFQGNVVGGGLLQVSMEIEGPLY